MKFSSTLLVLGLCALTLQLAFVNCQTDDAATDEGNAEDTGATEIENAEVSGESTNNSGGSDDENEEEGENNDDNSEADQSADDSSADGVSNSEASSTNEEDTNSDTVIDETDETDVVESSGDESADVVVDDTPDPPAVGTTVSFNMQSSTPGLDVTIYFTQMSDALQMHCEVSAQAGTSSASFWPSEFVEEDVEEIEEDSSGSEGTANEESGNDDSNTVEGEENDDTPDEEANEDSSSNDGEETPEDNTAEESTGNADTPETDGDSETVDSVIDSEEGSNDSGDDSSLITDNEADNTGGETDESDANEGDEDITAVQDRATTCSGTMPHLYLLKDTTCCIDPAQAQCASSEGKLLGCIEATGIVEHDITDLSFYDVEAYCLAISDKEADVTFRRTPKFIAAGPSFFRTFSLFNFNSVNFLSSGTKTITSSASTGSISIHYPSPSTNYGGSYTPGILDTLPHIRLEGLTADHVYVVIALLMLTYLATIFFPLLNLGPLLSGISGPFSRMGDFASEKMDVIADKVRASIRSYNRRYYNNVRRVDYDTNYEYYDDDEDYYYYVK